MKKSSKIASAVIAGVVCAAQVAVAGESGSFDVIESAVHDYTVMEHAGTTITSGPLHGTTTVLNSSGGPFAEGNHHSAMCLVYGKKSTGGVDLEAPCVFTDSSGDKWYLLAKRSAGDTAVGGGGKGNQRIVGGTGKYAGITGNCPYETRYLPDKWLVSTSTCTWQKP